MARGFLTGAATGLVISVAAAAGLSILMGYPTPPDGVLPEPDVATGDVTEGRAPEAVSDVGDAPSGETTPATPQQGTAAGLNPPGADAPIPEGTDTQPAAAPNVAGAGSAMDAPAASGGTADISVSTDMPRIETTPGQGPAAPVAETELSISTDPAQPPLPDMPDDGSAFAPPAPATEDAAPEPPTAMADATDTPDVPASLPDVSAGGDAVPSETAAPEPMGNADAAASPASTGAGGDAAATAEPTATTDDIAALAPQAPASPSAAAPDPSADNPILSAPARPLTERADAARSTRLPTIGAAPATGPDTDAPAQGAAADPDALPPFKRYAANIDAPPGTPRMAIILIDDGKGPLGPEALNAFPFPVTFAVDPGAPDAAARMAGYREKGFEVLALVDMPEGARASDVEIAFEAALQSLKEVVGVLEGPSAGLQGARAVSEQVAAYLAASGHGLVMQGQGLNTATSLAQREGVPAGAIFRDIDGDNQDPGMQRRLLDRVALRARQDGEVIALGRLKADTVSALLLWGLQDRANELALVPISGVIAPD
ncbi:divergent polysaccharide deacetylase family protein [Roseivivax sp. CAU 1753]